MTRIRQSGELFYPVTEFWAEGLGEWMPQKYPKDYLFKFTQD